MTHEELNTQCMAVSRLVDTEIVDKDPRMLASFDATTLYVWLAPGQDHAHDGHAREHYTNSVHGRFGQRDEVASSVQELAKKLGATRGWEQAEA